MLIDEQRIIETIEQVSPSVVSIGTAHTVRHLHEYFYHEVPVRGVGSGTIIDPEGIVLTNSHVVSGGGETNVILASGESYRGDTVGFDRTTDIAVVKVDATGLPACTVGDSAALRVGQFVLAIGNSLGLAGRPTVTSGLVSAVNRSIEFPGGVLENMIQTDASINPGNSGGPLVDSDGRVVGINTAIIPFAQGIGFSIPVNAAVEVADELRKFGRIMRPWLGIYGRDVNEPVAAYYGLGSKVGALVIGTVPNGPADQAGLQPGDIVVGLNGTSVANMRTLTTEIKKHKAGEAVDFEIVRGANRFKTAVTLQPSP